MSMYADNTAIMFTALDPLVIANYLEIAIDQIKTHFNNEKIKINMENTS